MISNGPSINPILRRIDPIGVLTPISLRSILILSYQPCLGRPRGPFLVCLSVEILKALLPSSIRPTHPAHFNHLDLITL